MLSTDLDTAMSLNNADATVAMVMPIGGADSLLATVLVCAVVLGAALLYGMNSDRYR